MMTHEFKTIVETAYLKSKKKHVLATVVALDGSSYRKPGVQMLITEDGVMTGAVSGGCVEKEVKFRAESVFKTGTPKVMTYDGRYRLGCEGILYILLEPFEVTTVTFEALQKAWKNRQAFAFTSNYVKEEVEKDNLGSQVALQNGSIVTFRKGFKLSNEYLKFTIAFPAISQLVIIGSEHDAVALSNAAALMGWNVHLVASPRDPRTIENFPSVTQLSHLDPEMAFDFTIDTQTAVVLMNHNYARDLHFLLQLQEQNPFYIGILGSAKRREKLMNELIELHPDIDFDFTDSIYSPAGINIGAITPQEIAISILSELVAIQRKKEVPSLRAHMGSIHNS